MGILLGGPIALPAQEIQGITSGVFQRHAERVVKIQVAETGSGARAGLGSGFFVSDEGHIVTNYHVIAELVHEPERYRAEVVRADASTVGVEVLAIDVVHDLAVVHASVASPAHFALEPASPTQGERLYSLGHPHDLGLSIVEGTYNGLLEHTLYPKIHFTGSINPGMSGGPAITADGRVVGVNVSTAGDQVSFLVPAERAAALVTAGRAPGYRRSERLLDDVGEQIRAYQDAYLAGMFSDESATVELGGYTVVTQPAPFFRCWGDASRTRGLLYQRVEHRCSTDDHVYIHADQQSGVVEIEHELVTADSLGTSRFFALYTSIFQRDNTPAGAEEHVTSWRCAARNVRNASTPLRAVLCMRRYRKLGELYDAVLKVAVLGRRGAGLVSTLTLSGVTFENVERLTGRYLESVTWP